MLNIYDILGGVLVCGMKGKVLLFWFNMLSSFPSAGLFHAEQTSPSAAVWTRPGLCLVCGQDVPSNCTAVQRAERSCSVLAWVARAWTPSEEPSSLWEGVGMEGVAEMVLRPLPPN